MSFLPAFCRAAAFVVLAAAPSLLLAVDVHVWEQSDASDFSRATTKRIAIRTDGRLTLSPEFKELDSTTVPYLWAIAQDSKGTVYYAGGAPTGATAQVFALPSGGKPHVFAELSGLEIHALAVDSQDRLYAAVLPDAKIYRFDHSGKSTLFFDPHAKYIWSMAFDRTGNLFVATGDAGLIYKVAPDGNGVQFANTDETHARSMIIDSDGNLIVGTEPGGLVIRISPQGKQFVLFQTAKREITAVAERNGMIYAAAVGSKPAVVTGPPPVLPSTPPAVNPAGTQRVATSRPSPAPPVGSLSASVTGGSDVYRIEKDGFAEKIWESSSEIVYALAFDEAGRPLLGTGNKGIVYRVDSPQFSTQIVTAPPTQVTAFLQRKNGQILAATGNVGNVYAIGPGLENTGTLESDVLDANEFSYWGKIHVTYKPNNGEISLEARSGNLNNPEHDWSPWTAVPVATLGGQIAAPPARFLQYRLTLHRSSDNRSPEVSLLDIPYLPKNIAPQVDQIEIGPYNYRQSPTSSLLERTVAASGAPTSITLPAVGQHRTSTASTGIESAASATLQYSKGFVTLRWSAHDDNHDSLLFTVELRGKNETVWRTLKRDLQDTHYPIDTTAFPDGEYVARITATDAPGNPPSEALSSSLESDPFTIDNTPPELMDVRARGGEIAFTAKDALSWLDKAEFSVNGGDWELLQPVNRVTDSQTLTYIVKASAGSIVSVRVFDENDNVVVKSFNVPNY